MKRFLKHIFLLIFIFNLTALNAQNGNTSATHKVAAGETVYSISHKYGLSVEDLRDSNPNLIDAGYGLKAGDVLVIPSRNKISVSKGSRKTNSINIGVMLPLNHSVEGRNMVEYYRGILMACEYLKREHYNINVHAWDVTKDTNIDNLLKDNGAAKCDIIFGPYYSHQIDKLGTFAKEHNIRLAIPFAPGGNEILNNNNLYVLGVFNPTFEERACQKFFSLFKKVNPIIVDCNDAKNARGEFTSIARKYFEKEDIKYNITNITSDEKSFIKAFKKNRNNVVILNSAGTNQFASAVKKIKAVRKKYPEMSISMLGYHEWFSLEKYNLADLAANDVYIPTYFYYNPQSAATKKIESDYYRWFNTKMLQSIPRYALIGYDHAMFFLHGINKFGKSFEGSKQQSGSDHVQMPMYFNKVSTEGGHQNAAFMFIHYKKDQSIESIAY